MGFKRIKAVTLPVIKMDEARYLRFEGAMYVSEKVVDDKKQPPTVAHVTDMETGEEGMLILGSVLVSELVSAYPESTYVGRIFHITKIKPEGARKYALWQIEEVEEDETETETETKRATKKGKG